MQPIAAKARHELASAVQKGLLLGGSAVPNDLQKVSPKVSPGQDWRDEEEMQNVIS